MLKPKIKPRQVAPPNFLAKSWKPGQSGNPKGRPPILPDVTGLARARTHEAIATLVKAMRHAPEWPCRIRAAESLLERGWGRAELSVDLKNSDGSFSSAWAAAVTTAVSRAEERIEQRIEQHEQQQLVASLVVAEGTVANGSAKPNGH